LKASRDDDYQNIYGLNELRALFNDLAKATYHFLALINACFGGNVFSLAAPGGSPSDLEKPGAYALTAGPRDKEVISSRDGQGSLFFNTIIQGVRTGDADHDAQSATLGLPGSDPDLSGVVRLGALDTYLLTALKKALASGLTPGQLEGNKHHWMGSVEPPPIVAEGGFFFFQQKQVAPIALPESAAFSLALHPGGTFSPSLNQLVSKTPPPMLSSGLDELRSKYPAPIRGIDVSYVNGPINWERAAAAGIRFVYIKASEGVESDPAFSSNWNASKEAGLTHGAYHVFDFCAGAEEQFGKLSRVPRDRSAFLLRSRSSSTRVKKTPIFRDYRGKLSAPRTLGPMAIQTRIKALSDLIERDHGAKPILYGNDYVLDKVLGSAFTKELVLWRVRYGLSRGASAGPWALWQYTENATIEGIAGGIDVNVLSDSKPAVPPG
jgi:GH25 family lysozyme M1 (1,4-beta-N-acetylmuramidase)